MPLTEYSSRQALLVVSIWIILEIRILAENQNHSSILWRWTYQNTLQKIEYRFSVVVWASKPASSCFLSLGVNSVTKVKLYFLKKLCCCISGKVKHENLVLSNNRTKCVMSCTYKKNDNNRGFAPSHGLCSNGNYAAMTPGK